MSTAQSSALANAHIKRSEDITRRVENAINLLLEQGKQPSFYSVSSLAQVARSTLYRREDLKHLVVAAREAMSPTYESEVSDSLQRLKRENEQLRTVIGNLAERYWQVQLECTQLRKELKEMNSSCISEEPQHGEVTSITYYFINQDSCNAA